MDCRFTRRRLLAGAAAAGTAGLHLPACAAASNRPAPQTAAELWADVDPRQDPLEVEVVRQWRQEGGVFRYVRFLVGAFKGVKARMAAFYGFREGAGKKLPAVLHMHGGGQRAFLEEVKTYVARGYAALSVNWGGREMENARPGDPNTDWGRVDPTQNNVPGYHSLRPGPKQLEEGDSPRNCNWYLLTLGCRRGLTFLEQQAEVDPARIGIYGHSMGGNLTMYVAGTDSRVKAAAPSVGGQGFRTTARDMFGRSVQQEQIQGEAALFARTLGFESYAPLIRCPVLHLSGTNDFHGWMDDVYRTNALIPNQPLRYSFSPHLNHRFTPQTAVTRPLWLDHYLGSGPALPETAKSTWQLQTPNGVPTFLVTPVTPDSSLPVTRVDIYYSIDPDPRARFWRDAGGRRVGQSWQAALPVLRTDLPLYAFANVYHRLPQPQSLPHMPNITEVCISSRLCSASPADLQAAGVRATDQPSLLIDDFARSWHDWYRLNADHRPLWENWTRKVTDPKWRGPAGASLSLRLRMEKANQLVLVAVENEWRSYRGKKQTYVATRTVGGSDQPQTLLFKASDFKNTAGGGELKSWAELDLLGICATFTEGQRRAPSSRPTQPAWNGPLPQFLRLEWVV